jgi:hypothetical protein
MAETQHGRIDISPMVERVARALAVANGGQNNGDDLESYGMAPHHAQARWLWHVKDARVAIETMREPAAWAVDEGCGEWVRIPDHLDRRKFGEKVADVWRKMIAASLVNDPGNPETQAQLDKRHPSPSGQITP